MKKHFKVSTLLKRAIDQIPSPKYWTKGAFRTQDGSRMCASQAIDEWYDQRDISDKEYYEYPEHEVAREMAAEALREVLEEDGLPIRYLTLTTLNDQRGTRHHHVIKALRRARGRALRQGV